MNTIDRTSKKRLLTWIGLAGVIGVIGVGAAFWKSDSQVSGKSSRSFTVNVDFDKFRQILLRTDATASIVQHGGMKLTHQSVDSLDIDLNKDSRPILNALTGKSKAELTSGKHLIVQLADPQLKAKELVLIQDSEIHSDRIHVRTESARPAGNLRSYGTSLVATQDGDQTRVDLTVDLSVDLHISPFLVRFARSRVRDATSIALKDQEVAIRELMDRFADKSMVISSL